MNELKVYRLENEQIKLDIINVGAAVTSLKVKDKNNQWQDVVLGFKELTHHVTNNDACFGAVVGRNANRIKNGEFYLNETLYKLEKNNGENNLHSGSKGFHLRLWDLVGLTEDSISLKIDSLDGDQGFPGKMLMTVEYRLVGEEVRIKYEATTNQDTLFNPTNHSYFNLNGHGSGTVLNHYLEVPSHYFMPMASDSVPTGERRSVVGTPMDFLTSKKIATQFDLSDEQLKLGNGYDHHFVLEDHSKPVRLFGEETGISLSVTTNMPGVQVYTANFVKDVVGKEDVVYQERTGICLETQFCPNSINLKEELSPVIKANESLEYETVWAFSTK